MAFSAGVTALGSKTTWAQTNYPERAVTFIVPQGPGTEVDWSARLYAQKLSELWGVPVVVENRVGAGGEIGIDRVAKSPGDGYTLLHTGGSYAVTPALKKTSYDPVKSLKPVMLTGVSHFALVVSEKLGVATFKEFLALAKLKPGSINYGSPGNGSIQHLSMEVVKKATGIDIKHVPYKAGGSVIVDLVSGVLDAAIVSPPQVIEMEKNGRLRILALLAPEREGRISATPTIVELGYPDAVVTGWSARIAPGNTSDQIIEKISRDIQKVRNLPEVQQAISARAGKPDMAGGPPARLAALIESDLKRWRSIVSEQSVKLN